MASVPALPGHALSILLIQMGVMLLVARVLAEGMKRIGQPAVLGELLGGIVLGPSLLGWFWPAASAWLFPAEELQVHLLEVVAWIGMVLLLLLTGLETDIRLLRHLGRAALSASVFGMLVPFVSGFLLGMFLPGEFVAQPEQRLLFAAFLATALSISAMPVIAKILFDLELTKRNISLVILSAGVVDDTTGWLLLSLIAGIAGAKSQVLLQFSKTLGLTALFLVGCRYIVYPVCCGLFRWIDDKARTPHAEITVIVIVAFVLASITEKIGIHAVFGAFVAGCLLRQVPTLRASALHRLESVAVSVFAPIFFGLAGLKVELRSIGSGSLVGIVLLVATAGKVVGCTLGGLLGRMTFWESLSIGVAMNARGAMELVVALIGLNLGILNSAMYASIVVMAIVTSFLAPIGLRLVLPKVKLTAEEEARLNSTNEWGVFDPARLKILLPTAGGPNALWAGRMAAVLARGQPKVLSVLHVQQPLGLFRRLWRFVRPNQASINLQEHLDILRGYSQERQVRMDLKRSSEANPFGSIYREAAHGIDLLFIGAGLKAPLRSSLTSQILEHAPCHVAIVRGRGAVEDAKRILVATNGSFFSRAAVEMAILYAEMVDAKVTVLYLAEEERDRLFEDVNQPSMLDENFRKMMSTTLLLSMAPLLTKTKAEVSVIVRTGRDATLPVIAEAKEGHYHLLMVGAENRAVQHRLSVGYDVERMVKEAACSVVVVVPRITAAPKHSH